VHELNSPVCSDRESLLQSLFFLLTAMRCAVSLAVGGTEGPVQVEGFFCCMEKPCHDFENRLRTDVHN
jgi:hypothetical protein